MDTFQLAEAPICTGKKWEVRVPTSKGRSRCVRFGAKGYLDYTIFPSEARREAYRKRHSRDRIMDPYSSGFWAWHVLWGETPNREANFQKAVSLASALLDLKNQEIMAP